MLLQLKQRFDRVGRAIGEAAQACSVERNLPGELRECIRKLDRHADTVQRAGFDCDEQGLRKLVDEWGQLGDRACRVCVNVPTLTPQMKSAVLHVHEELQELKRDVN